VAHQIGRRVRGVPTQHPMLKSIKIRGENKRDIRRLRDKSILGLASY
jgi:hypothetical protein